jgi:hypothetical protein
MPGDHRRIIFELLFEINHFVFEKDDMVSMSENSSEDRGRKVKIFSVFHQAKVVSGLSFCAVILANLTNFLIEDLRIVGVWDAILGAMYSWQLVEPAPKNDFPLDRKSTICYCSY